MESTNSRLGFGAPDRGTCQVCGTERKLVFTTGMMPRHDGCPGGGRPPARPGDEQTVELPPD